MIKAFRIHNWRQFENISIDFHPRLTIITGANGAGKTTILNIVNRHLNWHTELIGTPQKDKETGVLKFFSGVWNNLILKFLNDKEKYNPNQPLRMMNNQMEIGSIEYVNSNQVCKLSVPLEIGNTYRIECTNMQHVLGIPIPSHRPIYKYQSVPHIPTQLINKEKAYNNYFNSRAQKYNGNYSDKFENYYIKETLISLATFGYGNNVVEKNDEAVKIYEGFQDILRQVLPPKLGFEKIIIRIPEVILDTKSGEFSIDSVSGGIASIIDLAWQIFMFDNKGENFIVTIDEPENHLHPEMQRTLLPNFINAFPKAQFIVATHNPFIINSVSESNIYVLNYNPENKVKSLLLESIEKSGTANDILREVLGIDTTMPNWVEEKINIIISKYSDIGITKENLTSFKNDMSGLGFDKYIPNSITNLIDNSK